MTNTAKQLANKYVGKGAMPNDIVEQMYSLRDMELAALANKAVITINDVHALERTGRSMLADTLFQKCDTDARNALLNDEHHFVRACASISNSAMAVK